ncbi:MAG: 16S rRNA processing protein RimM [Desulfobacter sp.]|nr:16S rRNA processing protein RimM [Desulfobacter sp.]WDP85733.1 MAG: 16S rRNA processing protein RimM [Desulfobacter sp.]
MKDQTWLTIGKITGVHGLAGGLKVWSFAQSLETFEKGITVNLRNENGKTVTPHVIDRASDRKKGILLFLKEVKTREQAEDLVGKEIIVDKDLLPALEQDTWYWKDLQGLRVEDQTLGKLGTIERIFPTGADDILVVTDKNTKTEILIPMNRHFVTDVDIETGQVTTDLPPGFILE